MFKNNLKVIFATTLEGYFSGPNNTLPWDPKKVPSDLSHFKYFTTGKGNNAVVMGRDTYLSIINGRNITHLKDRLNIVISSTLKQEEYPDIIIVKSINESINKANEKNVDDIFFIGGRKIIKEVIDNYYPTYIYWNCIKRESGFDGEGCSKITDKEFCINMKNDGFLIPDNYWTPFYNYEHPGVATHYDNFDGHSVTCYQYVLTTQFTEEQKYIELVKRVLETGKERTDRTGTGTLSLFAQSFEIDVSERFPMLTTKRVFWKGVVEELLFFISGSSDTKILENKGINIWKGNTSREFLDSRNLYHYREGEYGPSYGYQWRHFGKKYDDLKGQEQKDKLGVFKNEYQGVDQLKNAINLIKTDPTSRRILVSAWNPDCLRIVPLPSCHYCFQFYVEPEERKLSILVNMRSCDVFLGLPFNIASYALLLYIVARICDLKPSKITFMLGDTHIYKNHVEQCKEQLSRIPRRFPKLKIEEIKEIDDYVAEDFVLEEYNPHPTIKAEMAV
jgi:thymidylate synthase